MKLFIGMLSTVNDSMDSSSTPYCNCYPRSTVPEAARRNSILTTLTLLLGKLESMEKKIDKVDKKWMHWMAD